MKKRIITLLVALFAVVTLTAVMALTTYAVTEESTPIASWNFNTATNAFSGLNTVDGKTFLTDNAMELRGGAYPGVEDSTNFSVTINAIDMSSYNKMTVSFKYKTPTCGNYLYNNFDGISFFVNGDSKLYIKDPNESYQNYSNTFSTNFSNSVTFVFGCFNWVNDASVYFDDIVIKGVKTYGAITLYKNDGEFAIDYEAPAKYQETIGTVTLPTAADIKRAGYVFEGWTATNDPADTTYITTIPTGTTGDKVFYAKWTEAEAEIDFGSGNVQYYRTFKDALADVKDSTPRTIKLLKDITVNYTFSIVPGRDITIDMNGKTITCDRTSITVLGSLTVTSSAATPGIITGKILEYWELFSTSSGSVLTLSNVNIEDTTRANNIIKNYSDAVSITLDNVTFANNTCSGSEVYFSSGNLVLKNIVNFTDDVLAIDTNNSVVADITGLNKDSRINLKTLASSSVTKDTGTVFATGATKDLKDCFINNDGDKYNIEFVDKTLQLKLVTPEDRYAKVTSTINVGEASNYSAGGLLTGFATKYQFSQFVYPSNMLKGAGTVYSISFAFKSGNDRRLVKIYLKNVGTEEITDSALPVSENDLVYTGRTVVSDGKLTFVLDKPFEYDGGNLLVCINDVTGAITYSPITVKLFYSSSNLAVGIRDSVPYTTDDFIVCSQAASIGFYPLIKLDMTVASKADDTFEVGRQVGDVITGKAGIAKYSIDVSSFDYLPKTKNFSLKWLGTDPGVMTTFSLYSDRKGYLAIITKPTSPAGYYDFIISTGGKDDDEAKCETMTLAICPEAPEEGEGYEFFKGFIEIAEGYEVAKVDTFGNINWNDTLRTGDKYIHTQRYAVRLKATKTMPYSDYTVFTAPEFCSKEVQSKLTDGSFRTIRSGSGILDATKLVFANTANGWTIYNTTYNFYVGLTDSNTLAKTSTPFYWQYENSRLYAVRAENTSTSVTNRMASRPFSRFGKTAKYYLVIEDSNTFTLTQDGQKAVTTFWNRVEEAAHIKTISYTCNNQHILYCTDCRQQYYVDCVFDEATHKCVCGRVEPGYENTVLSVTFTSLEEESFKYKDDALNKEWYSADVKVTESNYEIDTMSYSFNGTDYRAGTEFSVDSTNATFYVKIIAKGGYEYLYYFNGTEFVTPV